MNASADGGDPLADFDRDVREARRRAFEPGSLRQVEDSVRSMVEAVQRLGGETHQGTDATGLITALVTGQGELTGVEISAYAIRDLSTVSLGAACLEAIAAARRRCGEAVAERMGELFGSAAAGTGDGAASGPPDLAALTGLMRDTARRIR
jgi:DNA-binding protein YbaB